MKEFRLDAPLADAYRACRDAVARLGWEVESIERTRIIARRGVLGFGRDATRIEIWLFADRQGTTVSVDGRVFGRGDRSRRHLADELDRLRNAAEVAAHGTPADALEAMQPSVDARTGLGYGRAHRPLPGEGG